MQVTIWHNPRCSTSRKTLALLRDNGIEPVIVEYLATPPTAAEINRVAGLMGSPPRAFLRGKEPLARELGLTAAGVSDDAIVAALVQHPILIERPIVIAGRRAALGRPPEAVLEIV
jgi:arsenate reductase